MFAINVKNVSKSYRFYKKPSDRLKEALIRRPLHDLFNSLVDVSFDVHIGECLGIIGDNGAGKSTILKIIAGTLTPSSGEINMKGRVAALLELGAGFHPEFTGRQNIWMNASLIGLDKDEIAEKEKSIIDFSELGDFIDRPIKNYSSGMVVRLAFSIATSVDPDILIIDEALSVGDQHFQEKSIERMQKFRDKKKTILFCSHGMFLINQLCDRAVWLDTGRVRDTGRATHITAAYENYNRKRSKHLISDKINGISDAEAEIGSGENINANACSAKTPVIVKSISLNGSKEKIELKQGSSLVIDVEYECFDDMEFFIAAGIRRNDDLVCHAANMSKSLDQPLKGAGVGSVTLKYKQLPFLHGEFSVVVFMMDKYGLQCFHKKESAGFSVLPPDTWDNEIGLLTLDHEWFVK